MSEQKTPSSVPSGNFHFEFLWHDMWVRSPHLARPYEEALLLVNRINAIDGMPEYRFVPWDGQ